jgi:hypothetical protein
MTTGDLTKQQGKKQKLESPTNLTKYFGSLVLYKKSDPQQQ